MYFLMVSWDTRWSMTLHEKWSFPLRIPSVNSADLFIFTKKILNRKLHFLCSGEVPLFPVKYLGQWFLNFKQTFSADPGYIFLTRSVVERCHLKFSINIEYWVYEAAISKWSSVFFHEQCKRYTGLLKEASSWGISNGKTVSSSNIFFAIIMCRSKISYLI